MLTAFRFLFSSTIATVLVTGIQLAASARPAMLCGQDPGSAVNIREAASLSARVIGTAKVGDRVNTLDEGIGGETVRWYRVQAAAGVEGWVSADYLRTGTDQIAVLQGDEVNVRSAASTSSKILHYGLRGDRVVVMESITGENGYLWHRVRFSSQAEGWVRGDLVQVLKAACN
ncbi:SH3 domain-containing protein [Phormidesmis sp. 146-12]